LPFSQVLAFFAVADHRQERFKRLNETAFACRSEGLIIAKRFRMSRRVECVRKVVPYKIGLAISLALSKSLPSIEMQGYTNKVGSSRLENSLL